MRFHSLVITGAFVMVAGPAFAAPSARSSDLAEQAATRQLNMQASQTAAPVTLAMNMPGSAMQPAGNEIAGTLAAMTNPPLQIVNATVLDSSGVTVGAVQRIEVTPQGQPTKVAIGLAGQDDKTVVLDADKVRYDAATNEIVARDSSAQIQSKAAS